MSNYLSVYPRAGTGPGVKLVHENLLRDALPSRLGGAAVEDEEAMTLAEVLKIWDDVLQTHYVPDLHRRQRRERRTLGYRPPQAGALKIG